jgi:PAS domain S-box-containing protein
VQLKMDKSNQLYEFEKPIETRAREPERELVVRRETKRDLLLQATVLDNVKDCVIATDLEGKITFWNPGASAIFGCSYGEMLGESLSRISQPYEGKKVAENQLLFPQQEIPVLGEWKAVHKDGHIVYLLLTSLPMRDKEGKTIGLIRVGKDITKHKRIEETLRTSEIRYRRLFEAAKDGVLLLDANTGQITDVNPYLIEKLGYSKEELISKKIWEIGAFKDTDLSKAGFRELQEKGYIHYESMPLATRAGRLIDVEFVSNSYLVEGEKVVQCNMRDITERKKAENALRESEEKLTEQNILLEQKNTALREIMNQNRDEKERIEKLVQANVDHLLKPVIEKLKGKGSLLAERYISILEANLKEITSSFGNDISSRMLSLTQKEIDICNMIKNGFSSKQISEAMNISTRTIETHRNSIRKKLDISKKDVNLSTYLKFLQ